MRSRYSRNHYGGRGQYSGETVNSKMNGWKKKQDSPADTYIEWRFECKCRQLSDGFRILTEWRKRKQQYISIMNTIIFDFQHYSRHDATHSVTILEAIEMLLGKQRVDMLSVGDLWLLLEVAYNHDTGMALTYEELLEMWEEDQKFQQFIMECIENDFGDLKDASLYYKQADNLIRNQRKMEGMAGEKEIDFRQDWPVLSHNYIMILVAEYIRKNHARRVVRITQELEKEIESVIVERLYKVSMHVSQMHGENFEDLLKELKPREKGFGNTYIHPQFVAAMLRIGDLLDIDNNRFSPYAMKHFGRLPLSSMAHLKKHRSITHFDISEHQISIEAHASEYEAAVMAQDWFGWIDREIENLICAWNDIVPEGLYGCTLTKSDCKVYLLDRKNEEYHLFNSDIQRDFSVNKKKLIKLLIGTSLYESKMEFLREYIQNALDAVKMQLWIDLKNGKYGLQMNPKVELDEIIPLDLEETVYNNYSIKLSVEWNKTKDKIQIKIIDRGIGIESAYLNNLLRIGTGWRGRIYYEEELREMPKWLYPTGGFGIGIQSAFMVTDEVEILTKSNKEVQGHRIILRSPEMNGNVSVEEISGIYEHGTEISLEIEPEKIQNWMQKKNNTFISETRNRSNFDTGMNDIFCPDAIIVYMQKFLEAYVKLCIPNSLFPIEVYSPLMEEKYIYCNPYWKDICYWKEKCKYTAREIMYEDKRYLCIYNFDEKQIFAKIFIVWSYSDCVFQIIKLANKVESENIKICFKNIIVNNADKSQLEDYWAYHTCMDFMGFKTEEYLKVHRNFFDEQFDLEKYCRRGFMLYFLYLQEHLERCEEEWNEFEAQLLRMNVFYSAFEKNCALDNQQLIELERYSFVETEENRYDVKTERVSERINLIEILHTLYSNLYGDNELTEETECQGIAVLLTEIMWRRFLEEKHPQYRIPFKHIKQWQENGIVEDEKVGKVVTEILNTVVGKNGVLRDERMVSRLLRNQSLKKVIVEFSDGKKIVYLSIPEKEYIYNEKEFYEFFIKTDESRYMRKVLRGKNAERYDKLCVSKLPYTNQEDGEKYLISPFNRDDYGRVKKYLEQGKRLDYAVFRELVWGKEGEETHNYRMMIDWVFEHQYQSGKSRRKEIEAEYEMLLRKIYQKCIRDNRK